MHKAFLLTLAVAMATIGIVSYFHFVKRVYPHTYIGSKDISYFDEKEIVSWLAESYTKPIIVKVRDRVYSLTLDKMGVLLDKKATINTVYEYNRGAFGDRVRHFLKSFSSQRMLMPSLVFTQTFTDYVQNTKFDFTKIEDRISVDSASQTVQLEDNEELYTMDGEHLKSLILFQFAQNKAVYEPRLKRVVKEDKARRIDSFNKHIGEVFSTPLEIVLQEGDQLIRTSFSSSELREIYRVDYVNGKVDFVPDEIKLKYVMEAKVDPLISRNKTIDMQVLRKSIITSFQSRAQGNHSAIVRVPVRILQSTNTQGEIASRYIEVDISSQKMYLFYEGNVINTYTISSGLHHPTPVGRFKIMNKALDAYSDIYNVYMPYWMAFYYGEDVDAYFGIHELPYWIENDGQRKQRPREFLGAPHTGGCVSLDIGAAREVYDYSFVGMDVVIFE